MKRRLEWTRRSWLWLGAATLLATGAGVGGAIAPAVEKVAGAEATVAVAEKAEFGERLPAAAGAAGAAAPVAGVRAFIDPATGELTANPDPAQLQRLTRQARASSVSRSVVGLRPFGLSRGGRGLNLHGRFQTALRVERGADGNFYQTCGDPAHASEPHSHGNSTATNHAAGSGGEPAQVQ